MRDEPTAANLLETALGVLKDRLLPHLPPECRYEALMVANAIGIATRQVRAGSRPAEDAHARLTALYSDKRETLPELEAALAADIRSGRFDPGAAERAAVFAHLWETAAAKARESNPKALAGREPPAAPDGGRAGDVSG